MRVYLLIVKLNPFKYSIQDVKELNFKVQVYAKIFTYLIIPVFLYEYLVYRYLVFIFASYLLIFL